MQVLTDSTDVKQYIKRMRSRDPELNSKWGTICTPVEMLAPDGKRRKTTSADISLRLVQQVLYDGKRRKTTSADIEGIFRIIQSIPLKEENVRVKLRFFL